MSVKGREFLDGLELPDAARERIEVSLSMIEALDRQLAPLSKACAGWPAARPVAGR